MANAVKGPAKPTDGLSFENANFADAMATKFWGYVRLTGGFVVAVGLGAGGAWWWQGQKQAAAEAALGALDQATTVEQYAEVAKLHPASPAAELARYRQAVLRFEQGKFAEAASGFSQVIGVNAAGSLVGIAQLGLAYAMEADGKPQVGEVRFTDAAGTFVKSGDLARAVEANVGAGRCAETQKKVAEAVKYYTTARDTQTDSRYRQAAAGALERIAPAAAALPVTPALSGVPAAGAPVISPAPAAPIPVKAPVTAP